MTPGGRRNRPKPAIPLSHMVPNLVPGWAGIVGSGRLLDHCGLLILGTYLGQWASRSARSKTREGNEPTDGREQRTACACGGKSSGGICHRLRHARICDHRRCRSRDRRLRVAHPAGGRCARPGPGCCQSCYLETRRTSGSSYSALTHSNTRQSGPHSDRWVWR